MDLNKYTAKSPGSGPRGAAARRASSHAQIEPEHLLTALVEQRDGVVPEVLRKMSVDPASIAPDARDLLAKIPQAYGGSQPGLSPRLKLVTDLAQAEADRLKDEFVSTEHLFIALRPRRAAPLPPAC